MRKWPISSRIFANWERNLERLMQILERIRKLDRRDAAWGGAGFLGALLIALVWPYSPAVRQPIRYNHEKHIAAGLQCADCHTLFSNSPWAGLPPLDGCMTCHEQPVSESREEAKVREFAKQAGTFHWNQVNRLPTHVYFSHQTHAVTRGISCFDCHGQMDKATAPPPRPFFAWTMEACMNCHEQQNATLDCNGCHR